MTTPTAETPSPSTPPTPAASPVTPSGPTPGTPGLPLPSHATFDRALNPFDPVDVVTQASANRIQELIPIRNGRMNASPFAFYRGAADIMANDLAKVPHSGLMAQLCGDAHIANFGIFASPERRAIFDINDFDETFVGPFEWDVKRLAASVVVASRHRGFKKADADATVYSAVQSYRRAMLDFASKTELEVWYAHVSQDALIARIQAENAELAKRAKTLFVAAETRDSMQALKKFTDSTGTERRIISVPPLIISAKDLPAEQRTFAEETAKRALSAYTATLSSERKHLLARYHFVDVARKVVGVGSVGTHAFMVLMQGKSADDPLFLQIKEAGKSVLDGLAVQGEYSHQGERVVAGQRLMQAHSDIMLGWCTIELQAGPRDFYVRQLRDWKRSPDLETILAPGLRALARISGWTLARAHARSGDAGAIAAYLGEGDQFERALVDFAQRYADQNEQDYAAFSGAIARGDLPSVPVQPDPVGHHPSSSGDKNGKKKKKK